MIDQSERETLAGLTADFNKEVRREVLNIQEKERRDKLVKEHQEAVGLLYAKKLVKSPVILSTVLNDSLVCHREHSYTKGSELIAL